MTEYEKIVDKMVKKYPHARAAFQYFLEQSHYDSMEEFLFDYGYMIDYDLEKYTENEYFYKDGMNNLYYDTIKRRRLQKTADGDTVYRYTHAEDGEEPDTPSEPEVDMEYTISTSIAKNNNGAGITLGVLHNESPIDSTGWTFYFKKESDSDFTQMASNKLTYLNEMGNLYFYGVKDSIKTDTLLLESKDI